MPVLTVDCYAVFCVWLISLGGPLFSERRQKGDRFVQEGRGELEGREGGEALVKKQN